MAKSENKTSYYLNSLDNITGKMLNSIGTAIKADAMANCVVHKIKPGEKYNGVPGTLRKGHHFKSINNKKSKKIIIGNTVEYAPYVEFKSYAKGGRPWLRKTLMENRVKYGEMVEEFLKEWSNS